LQQKREWGHRSILLFFMRIALLTNSRLSVPSIDFLGSQKLLAAVGLPEREGKVEDADHIQYTAANHNVPVTTFAKNDLAASLAQWLELHRPDVVLVYTFPFKIPTALLNVPAKGFINFHFGLLPQYRGADAIFWQIRNREKEGGVSVHQMTSQLDKGALYMIHKVAIHPMDTYGSHLLNLSVGGVQALQKLLPMLQSGNVVLREQDETLAKYYHRPALADVTIDWRKPAADIAALVNATNPWNKGAVAYLNKYPVKILAVTTQNSTSIHAKNEKSGTILISAQRNNIYVYCGMSEMVNLDILFCNDSFITGAQFAQLGITSGMQFE